jgi:hypothetical protein
MIFNGSSYIPLLSLKSQIKTAPELLKKNGPATGLGIRKISGLFLPEFFFLHGSGSDRQPVAMMKLVDSKSTKKHTRLCDKWCWYIFVF